MSTPRPEWGVIGWEHRIVCYEVVPEFGVVEQEAQFGGTVRIPVPTGRFVPEARVLGSESLLEMTPALRQAIEADRTRVKE